MFLKTYIEMAQGNHKLSKHNKALIEVDCIAWIAKSDIAIMESALEKVAIKKGLRNSSDLSDMKTVS